MKMKRLVNDVPEVHLGPSALALWMLPFASISDVLYNNFE